MKTRVFVGLLFVMYLLAGFSTNLPAQEKDCGEIGIMASLARAQSQASLMRLKRKAGDSYGIQAVFAARQFELIPTSKEAAALLLNVIPQNHEQQDVWDAMNNYQCEGETDQEMSILAKLKYIHASDLARAVMLVPKKLLAYVSYAGEAVQDPDNDYAVQMRRVCRSHHKAFVRAVDLLGKGEERNQFSIPSSAWFRGHIFNPDGCKTLAFPEAD